MSERSDPIDTEGFDHAATVPFVIVRLAGALRQAFGDALAELGISPPQFGVLVQFAGGRPLTAAAIARIGDTSPQAIGAHIDALVSRGLLSRTPRPGRGRPNELRITDEGAETLRRAMAIARVERDRVTGFLGDAERETLLGQLREIGERARGAG